MTWTPDLIIGLAANVATAIIAAALMLLVLWQGRHRLENWLFALLMLLFAGSGGFGAFSYFAQRLDFHPRNLLYFTTTLYGIAVVILFISSSQIARIPKRVTVVLAVLGAAILVYLLPQLWDGRIYTDFVPSDNGANYHYRLASTGLPGLALIGAYLLLSSVVLYQHSPDSTRQLWLAPAIMLGAMLLFLVPLFDKFPKNAVAISISSLIMARVVLQAQLFNPLAQLNRQLEDTNAQLATTNQQLTDANAQLAAASVLKSQFLATMSHELRTPLNSIIGYTELVLEGTYGTLTEIQADRLQKVARNGHNLLSLINDVLDLSKIEAGRLELAIIPLNIHEIIDNVITSFDPVVQEKKLAIVRDYADLPRTMADAGRARQIITNLVSNAVKFTTEGAITVRGRTNRAAGMVEISVSDTGIGIDEKDLPYIFDEFRQVDSFRFQVMPAGRQIAVTWPNFDGKPLHST
jgi:signal transduction histidine kinase